MTNRNLLSTLRELRYKPFVRDVPYPIRIELLQNYSVAKCTKSFRKIQENVIYYLLILYYYLVNL